jgi:ribosomal protein L11 methyltransferase
MISLALFMPLDIVSMEYLEYNFTTSDEQTAEILIALLAEKGFDTFDHDDVQLSAYIRKEEHLEDAIAHFLHDLQERFVFTWSFQAIAPKNWNEEWEKNFEPIRVGDDCLIRAPFHQADAAVTYDIIIEPRMSFGTGHHETTYLMSKEILGLHLKGKRVADAGTGTGILAILAAKKGAGHVFAVDNEEWAWRNAIDNMAMNNTMDVVQVELGGLDLLEGKTFDVILANINKHIILEHIPLFFRCLQPGGMLVISGMFNRDLQDVEKEASRYFFQLISTQVRNDWVCAVFQNV